MSTNYFRAAENRKTFWIFNRDRMFLDAIYNTTREDAEKYLEEIVAIKKERCFLVEPIAVGEPQIDVNFDYIN